jgi:beta-xylosidase
MTATYTVSAYIMALRNPIIPGHNPDPTIIRDGQDYFLVTSTFEYFPGLPVYQSQDLVNWDLTGHALDRPSQLNMRTVETGGGVFAPSLRKWKGRFYLACTAMYRVPNMENFTSVSSQRYSARSPASAGNKADQQGMVPPRGFYVWTDDIRAGNWSDPVYFDTVGIDQDVR